MSPYLELEPRSEQQAIWDRERARFRSPRLLCASCAYYEPGLVGYCLVKAEARDHNDDACPRHMREGETA